MKPPKPAVVSASESPWLANGGFVNVKPPAVRAVATSVTPTMSSLASPASGCTTAAAGAAAPKPKPTDVVPPAGAPNEKPPLPEDTAKGSFVPLLRDGVSDFREVVFCDSSNMNITVFDGRWKYVYNWNPRDLDELYDLENDHGEMHNLAGDDEHKSVRERLHQQLVTWLHATEHPYADVMERAASLPVSVEHYPACSVA